jgi:hypothetical protein
MRRWSLSDGRRLVEEAEGTFRLERADGSLERTWRSGVSSEREHLYTSTYFVEDGELRCRFEVDNYDSDAPPSVSVSVELRGLRPA